MTDLNNTMIGTKFNRWTVTSNIFSIRGHKMVDAICECGNLRQVRVVKLKTGASRSCGCLRNEELTTHGQTKRATRHLSHEYWIWNAMIQRCTNKDNRQFPDYGGRGINVDEKWLKFEGFLEDMGFRPTTLHSIDRTDNSLGYCKTNCEWKLRVEQNRNRRNNHTLTLNGESLCVSAWAEKLGCTSAFIFNRIKRGWTDKKILTKPSRTKVKIT